MAKIGDKWPARWSQLEEYICDTVAYTPKMEGYPILSDMNEIDNTPIRKKEKDDRE